MRNGIEYPKKWGVRSRFHLFSGQFEEALRLPRRLLEKRKEYYKWYYLFSVLLDEWQWQAPAHPEHPPPQLHPPFLRLRTKWTTTTAKRRKISRARTIVGPFHAERKNRVDKAAVIRLPPFRRWCSGSGERKPKRPFHNQNGMDSGEPPGRSAQPAEPELPPCRLQTRR